MGTSGKVQTNGKTRVWCQRVACLIGLVGCEPDQFVSMGDDGPGATAIVSNAGSGANHGAEALGDVASAGRGALSSDSGGAAGLAAATTGLDAVGGKSADDANSVHAGGVSPGDPNAGGVVARADGVDMGGAGATLSPVAGQTHRASARPQLRLP